MFRWIAKSPLALEACASSSSRWLRPSVFTDTLACQRLLSSSKSFPFWCWRSEWTTFSSWCRRTSASLADPTRPTTNTLAGLWAKWARRCSCRPYQRPAAFSSVLSSGRICASIIDLIEAISVCLLRQVRCRGCRP